MQINIRQTREKVGMSLADLAYKINVNPSYISLIERGVKIPTLENLICIASILGCTLDDLIVIDADDSNPATA